ncbi:MAG: response regulator transcription factor [Chloroflexota bacterium]
MTEAKRLRVLIADDHPLFREGVTRLIAEQPDMEVVGEASDGLEALVKARELRPDLILMDVTMPGSDGLEATRLIKVELPETRIIILTQRDEGEILFEAISSGAQGYLLKTLRSQQLLEGLRSVMEGGASISPLMTKHLIEEIRHSSQTHADAELEPLTAREQEILRLIAQDASNQEIADTLYLSLHTVKSHVKKILEKLQAPNRHQAALYARRKGLI